MNQQVVIATIVTVGIFHILVHMHLAEIQIQNKEIIQTLKDNK